MDLVEAVTKRKSVRAFRPDPVPQEVLKEMMGLALRAPSWGNTQPWEFSIVCGHELEEIRRGFIEKAEEAPTPDIARPPDFPEPYGTRRRGVGAKFYEAKGITRQDREKRGWWQLQGLKHFGAPCVIYIYIDRSFYSQPNGLNVWPLFDCGLVAENIMLLATAYGLGTIPQAQAVIYPEVIKKVLGIPDSKLIVLAISVGYPDEGDAINQFHSEREPLEKLAKWHGFD